MHLSIKPTQSNPSNNKLILPNDPFFNCYEEYVSSQEVGECTRLEATFSIMAVFSKVAMVGFLLECWGRLGYRWQRGFRLWSVQFRYWWQ